MYSRQDGVRRPAGMDIPLNYGGSAFVPFQTPPPPPPRPDGPPAVFPPGSDPAPTLTETPSFHGEEPERAAGTERPEGCGTVRNASGGQPPAERSDGDGRRRGSFPLFGPDAGTEELVLLGILLLLFSDPAFKDEELIVMLLLILFL